MFVIDGHSPKLPGELGEDVLQLGAEVPLHVVLQVADAVHLTGG